MQVTCSNCQSKIRVPDSAAGKKGKCPKCGNVIVIPALEAPADEPAPAAAGSPFDFSGDEPPPARKSSRQTDDAVEAPTPSRKSKARLADDKEVVETADDDEAEDNNIRRSRKGESKGLSLASMICGIVSLVFATVGTCCCGFIPIVGPIGQLLVVVLTAIAAIIMGFIGKSKGAPGFAITGIICGGVSLVLLVIGVVLVIVFFGAHILIVGAGGR